MRCLLAVFLFTSSAVHAQPQHSNWYFGFGASMGFAGGATSLGGGPLSTDEGCASISDAAGQLLFFTNGEQVWDRELNVMPNGSGLAGHFSAAQSAVIVPFVNEPGLYYLFTAPSQVATWGGGYNGLTYSVVDMSLNGGLGDVTFKNIELQGSTTEHLTAVRHANGRDAWVVARGWDNNTYCAYLITCTGVEGPVLSQAGESIVQDIWGQFIPAIGCMDISPQGDRLAITWSAFATEDGRAHLDVLGFDNATGMVSDGWAVDRGGVLNTTLRGYGVQFSPNGELLYWSTNGLAAGIGITTIEQFDLTAPDPAATAFIVATANSAFGTMQAAPDGMVYCATLDGAQHVTRIMQPNEPGAACSFDATGISTAPNMVTWGLGNDWDTFPPATEHAELIEPADTVVCAGRPFDIDVTVNDPFGTPTYLWNTGASTPVITVDDDGWYRVEVTLSCDVVLRDSIEVMFSTMHAALGADRLLCQGDSVQLIGPDDATELLWSTGETTRVITVGSTDEFWLEASDAIGCTVRDEVLVTVYDCTCPVFVPNAFTPNADAFNDAFAVVSECPFSAFTLRVHDRWGRELFTTQDPRRVWVGDVPIGTYVWTLEYEWPIADASGRATQRGHVTVVR